MPEFPIVIHEEHNAIEAYGNGETQWYGYKVSYVNYGIMQWSAHRMDRRATVGPGRLTTEAVGTTRSVILEHVWDNPVSGRSFYRTVDSFVDGEFYIPGGGLVLGADGEAWDRTTAAIKDFLDNAEWAPNGNTLLMCPDDGIPVSLHTSHGMCEHCEVTGPNTFMYTVEVQTDFGSTQPRYLCVTCTNGGVTWGIIDGIFYCAHCGNATDEDFREDDYCGDCYDNMFYCNACDMRRHYDDGYEEDDYGELTCQPCVREGNNPGRFIQAWNYRPELVFHPMIPTNPLKPLYIGMELEMSWPAWSEKALPWLERLTNDYEDILYVKRDSSVNNGFEVVTHPMSPDWATEQFPFDFFQEAIDQGARETHESCGTHIHIDKGALSTAQMWKLMQVHIRLREFCGTVGGRGTNTSYANWDSNDEIKANLKEIARLKGAGYGAAARYVPVNVQNEQTIELRYMRGSIHPNEIRKNIEWVQALYEFTDYISVEDVKNGVIDSPGYLLGWIMNDDRFANLTTHLEKNLMIPAKMPERTV